MHRYKQDLGSHVTQSLSDYLEKTWDSPNGRDTMPPLFGGGPTDKEKDIDE